MRKRQHISPLVILGFVSLVWFFVMFFILIYHEESQSFRKIKSFITEYDKLDLRTKLENASKHLAKNTIETKVGFQNYITYQSKINTVYSKNKIAQHQINQRKIILKNWNKENYNKLNKTENIDRGIRLKNKKQEGLNKKHTNSKIPNHTLYIQAAKETTLNILEVWPENAQGESKSLFVSPFLRE